DVRVTGAVEDVARVLLLIGRVGEVVTRDLHPVGPDGLRVDVVRDGLGRTGRERRGTGQQAAGLVEQRTVGLRDRVVRARDGLVLTHPAAPARSRTTAEPVEA